MPAEHTRRHGLLVALLVVDDDAYARYRAEMKPILEEYGGRFGCDLVVARVLAGVEDAGVNRVFTIDFPSATAQDGFFADARYLAVRERLFTPSVGSTQVLAEFDLASTA